MSTPDATWLQQVFLFSLLDDTERNSLLQCAVWQRFAAHDLIFSAGEPGNSFYVIAEGRVEIYLRDSAHERMTIAVMEPGEIFGELSVLDNLPRSASAKALEETTLLVITRHDLLALVTAHPEAALDMMAMLGQRIRRTSTLAQNRATVPNPNREIAQSEQRTFGHRIADRMAAIAGDMRFIYFSLVFIIGWYVINLGLITGIEPFDPFPFGLLTMLLTVETIFLTLILLISQNRAVSRDRIRNDVEYQVNVQAEAGVREMHSRMEEMEALILKLLERVDSPVRP
jgi:uncharacterized membrane protein